MNKQAILAQFESQDMKFGDVKKLAKTIKVNHDLAFELWATKEYMIRMLSTLIFDKKQLSGDDIESLAADMYTHTDDERNRLSEWLLANQLMKSKKLTNEIENWKHHDLSVLRRLYWYYQARLRWTGKIHPNSSELLDVLEKDMTDESEDVQWAMNFLAGQIGVYQPEFRDRCIALGEKLGLYKDEVVSKGCTPSYLPEFIRIEVEKRS